MRNVNIVLVKMSVKILYSESNTFKQSVILIFITSFYFQFGLESCIVNYKCYSQNLGLCSEYGALLARV